MQKPSILFVIVLTSIVVMACGFVGVAQQKIEDAPIETTASKEKTVDTENVVVEDFNTNTQIETTLVPTIDPVQAAKSCLANTWEIDGLSDYVVAAVPPDLVAEYDLQYQETNGHAYFTLSPNGQIELIADNLEFLFTAKVSIFEVPVTVKIDGVAVGNYEVDETNLTTTNMNTSNLIASAQALNEDLIDSDQIINSIPFLNPPFNTAKYSCQSDTLELRVSGYPGNIPPLVFRAVD
jgi:hypothetical protein